jgi:hypothetical protein
MAEPEESDLLTSAVRSTLAVAHTRVSAVVHTSMFPGRSQDGILGWRVRSESIEQPKATHPLAADVNLPGRFDSFEWIPGDWRHGS